MNEKEMIEEMAKDIVRIAGLGVHEKAEYLYNAGYRKISENSVVLTKEEYDLIDHNIKHLETVCNAHEEEIDRLEKLLDDKCDRCIESDRKKTAKEILKEVAKTCGYYQWFKNLCKQYGVEE